MILPCRSFSGCDYGLRGCSNPHFAVLSLKKRVLIPARFFFFGGSQKKVGRNLNYIGIFLKNIGSCFYFFPKLIS